jgi:hypothetical protein
MTTYVSVIGGSECDEETAALAEEVGRLLAARGCVVVCGGMDAGVMRAVASGARRGGGRCLGVLPGTDRRRAAPDLDLSICTGIGHARNLAVIASGDVVIAVDGAWGTLSEIGLARSIGRQVVILEGWRLEPPSGMPAQTGGEPDGAHRAGSPAEAVELALSLIGA